MQLLEFKNDTAKIIYNPAENYLLPADFLLVKDGNQKLIVQVTSFETSPNKERIVVARPALSIDNDDNISYYNGYIPAGDSLVLYVNSEEIAELIEGSGDKIFLGSLVNKPDCFVKPDISFIDDKLYIRSDNDDAVIDITKNLLYQLDSKNKKVVLFDFDGSYSELKKVKRLKVSENFRLPLNINAFDTILKYDTKECPVADKAVIQSIVLELREYLKTLDDGFLPFTAFKNVIDSEFEDNKIPGLMLLKNKLYLYSQDNVFADKKEEFDVIYDIFFNNNIVVIDASDIEEKWYKSVIQCVTERLTMKAYLFLSLNDTDFDKKFFTSLYKSNCYIPVISTSYNSNYALYMSQNAKNFIFCKPQDRIVDNQPYSSLLNKINNEEFIVYGNATYRLPLLLNYKDFGEDVTEEIIQNEIKKDVDKFFVSSKGVLNSENISINENINQNLPEKSDNDFNDSDLDFLDEEDGTVSPVTKNETWEENWNDEWKDEWQETPAKSTEPVFELMPVEKDDPEQNTDDIQDLFFESDSETDGESGNDTDTQNTGDESDNIDKSETGSEEQIDDDFIIFSDDEEENLEPENLSADDDNADNDSDIDIENDEDLFVEDNSDVENESEEDILIEDEQELALPNEDDLIFDSDDDAQTSDEQELSEENDVVSISDGEDDTVLSSIIDDIETRSDNASTEPREDDASDDNDDIVFLEDEDDGDQELQNEEELLPPEVNEEIAPIETPDVKVYETDIPENEEQYITDFKTGDRVYHPKHGFGVIEGFANYSNKIMFCQIEFENVGRRMLDPKVSNLQKVEEQAS